MKTSVSHPLGYNASAARSKDKRQSAFPFGGPGTLSFGKTKESASGKYLRKLKKRQARRGGRALNKKTAAKPIIRQFAANKLQYFPTLALSKSGQWVEARASSQPCGSPFGNAIILYRAKFCNRNFAPGSSVILSPRTIRRKARAGITPRRRAFTSCPFRNAGRGGPARPSRRRGGSAGRCRRG